MTTQAYLYQQNDALKVPPRTGWPAGMLQDDCKPLSKWLASKPDARRRVREAVAAIATSDPARTTGGRE